MCQTAGEGSRGVCSGARGQGRLQQGGQTASARECTKSLLGSKPCNTCIVHEGSPHPLDRHTGAQQAGGTQVHRLGLVHQQARRKQAHDSWHAEGKPPLNQAHIRQPRIMTTRNMTNFNVVPRRRGHVVKGGIQQGNHSSQILVMRESQACPKGMPRPRKGGNCVD